MADVAVTDTGLYVLDMDLRMPFSFGTVTVTQQPHLFVCVDLDVGGEVARGVAADGLSPAWFLKETPFEEGLRRQFAVIRAACRHARALESRETVFDLWHALYERQRAWADGDEDVPPLLWGFGVSLVERAIIDAFCRARGTTFGDAVREGALGTRLGVFADDLAGREPGDLLPTEPTRSLAVRHTVGLGDPLTEADLGPDAPRDGLPRTLVEYVRADGLDRFKVKVGGDPDPDLTRLDRIATVLDREVEGPYAVSLDANESFPDAGAFRSFWERLADTPELDRFRESVLFVEQPLPRDRALAPETTRAFDEWADGPPVIIDESDDRIGRLAEALECGYDGTSHKNVKGVFKGVAGACLVAHRNRTADGEYVLSGEDASNVGPVALPQDSAVVGTLGLDHAERNGHHYFRGLSALPEDLQDRVLEAHGDLYARHADGFPTVDVTEGRVEIGSTVDAPFGHAIDLDPSRFTPLDDWTFEPTG
jgi:L-alanine-DL-glutamate epimerase-like enolase superfamily enzyme